MLYVIFNKGGEIFEKKWHVGENFPPFECDTVTEVQADGEELEWVKENIQNIPMAKNRVLCWYGDHAKFIANCLPF